MPRKGRKERSVAYQAKQKAAAEARKAAAAAKKSSPSHKPQKDDAEFWKIADAIIAARELGASERHAALSAGLAISTHRDWKRRGKDAKAKVAAGETLVEPMDIRCVEYVDRLKNASGVCAARHLQNINVLAFSPAIDPAVRSRNSQWLLTHAPDIRDDYAETQKHEHTGKDGGPIRSVVTLEEIDETMAAIKANMEDGDNGDGGDSGASAAI